MFSQEEFERVIAQRGVKITALAHAIGVSTSTIYKKNKRNGDYTVSEILAICDFLRLTPEERDEIFFA